MQTTGKNKYQILNDLLDMFLGIVNPLTGYNTILQVLLEYFEAERCLIIRNDEEGEKVVAASHPDLLKDGYSKSILSQAYASNQEIVIKRKEELDYRGESLDNREVTAMVLPLRNEKENYGWLYIDRRKPSYYEQDLDEIKEFLEKMINLFRWEDLVQMEIENRNVKWGLFVGSSELMRETYHQLQVAARIKSRCMILEGEAGTGKSLAARAIHKLSSRRDRPFIKLNCKNMSEEEMKQVFLGKVPKAESELDSHQKSIFEEASGGFLEIEEISCLSIELQEKLYNIISSGKLKQGRRGEEIAVDIRYIFSSRLKLWNEVKKGKITRQLFHYINNMHIIMPPLRKHKTDIVMIAKHLIREINVERGFMISGISPEMLSYLDQSNWNSGNVQELRNFLEQQATKQNGEGNLKLNDHVHPYVETPLAATGENLNDYLKKIRWKRIKEVWEKCGRNKVETAKKLGTPRRQLYRYLDDYELRYGKKLLK